MQLPSESKLIADMDATFPFLFTRPLREFGKDYAYMTGVWTGGPGDMPDGLPIFDNMRTYGDSENPADGSYDGGVHDGFTSWLEARGWYIERYDDETFFIVPTASTIEGLESEAV